MSKTHYSALSLLRHVLFLLLVLAGGHLTGQALTGTATVNNYSTAQKRLLVKTIFEYANYLTQHNLDQDSIMDIARQVTQLPFLLPYKETFPEGRDGPITALVNNGQLKEAKQALANIYTGQRIQGLLEIFLWYVHQLGNSRNDLDSASHYLQLATAATNTAGNTGWKTECLYQWAELTYQKENIEESKQLFAKQTTTAGNANERQVAANAFMRMGDLLPPTDSTKEHYYHQSYKLYQSLGLVEKQIEMLWKITLCNSNGDFFLAEKDLREIIRLSAETGFKHVFCAQNHLSYVLTNTGDYLGAMNYAKAAVENIRWSGYKALAPTSDIRMAIAHANIGETSECLKWLKIAMSKGTKENHLFWYRSIMFLTAIVGYDMNNPALAVHLIDSVTNKFPPITVWEKLQILSSLGTCYQLLNRPALAESKFEELLRLARLHPTADPYSEMYGDYLTIAEYYVTKNRIMKARQFIELAMVKERTAAGAVAFKYSLYYKMDSLEGNYKSALENHIKYKLYSDSNVNIAQRKTMYELNLKYEGEKKDKDIRLLTQQRLVQQAEIKKNKFVRDIMIAGTIMLLVIVALLFNRFTLKQRANRAINRQNIKLRHLVDEKEWLLKEVHHRVKNNLHTIISLLESQAHYLENDALKAIQNSQHRIYAMSLIHQKLYQSDDIKVINMAVYLPEFIRYLKESFNPDTQPTIDFRLAIETIHLGVSQAIPVALIINEAVTNAMKHAFQHEAKGLIAISMQQHEQQIVLSIADNGIGIDETLLNHPKGSLGVRLIKGLTDDINGQLSIKNDNGTTLKLVFTLDNFPGPGALTESLLGEPQYI
ncbi:MAG TPA: sensor histidine kinase [Chitinophagaceae bacterium]|nr:sensor histidine kinase [Chitinophagaceae bacterium]